MRTVPRAAIAWILPLVALLAVVAEWLRAPSLTLVGLAAACVALLLWRLRVDGVRGAPAFGLGVILLLGLLGWETRELARITDDWLAAREALVRAASQRIGDELHRAGGRGAALASAAAEACEGTRAEAFRVTGHLLPDDQAGTAIIVLQPDGSPWAWAGRPPAIPVFAGDSVGVQSSAHHLALETRRPCAHGREVVVTQLVWASGSDPSAAASLVELFRRATDVQVRVWPADSAPDLPDVFDYSYDTPTGLRTLFSLQAILPDQGARWSLVLERGAARVVAVLCLLLVAGFLVAAPGMPRTAIALAVAWLGVRAPFDRITHGSAVWSPASYFRDFLGPVSSSIGPLLIAGAVGTVLTAALWERRPRRRPAGLLLAGLLILGAPYLISSLARGITPPSDGVPLALWLTWQFALVASAGICVALAAALTRGDADAQDVPWTWWVGAGAALAAAWLGLSVWVPRGGWPDWYPLPWAVALGFLLWRPAPRWATIVGLGLVAGSAAALVTWGAELEGRLQVAKRDVQQLGGAVDPLAIPRAMRLAALADSVRPTDAADLYAVWGAAPAGGDDYPALLALWDSTARERTELLLDSVDAPPPLLAALVREFRGATGDRIIPVARIPGTHLVLLHRLTNGQVFVVVLGPRTQLIPSATISWLLEPPPRGAPLYDLVLGTPAPEVQGDSAPFRWAREGWQVTGDRHLSLPGGVRHVHAKIDLGRPTRLFVRGALVLTADVAFLALLWLLGRFLVGGMGRRPQWRRLVRSYRVRLAVALAGFFVVPALGFAAWTFARTAEDAGTRRDLLLAQTLRTAQPLAASLPAGADADVRLAEVTRGSGAEFGLYQGGRLVGVSHPVLADLGILPPLLPADAFSGVVLGDGLEMMTDAPGADGRPLRMGYRVIRSGGPGETAVLAAPRLSDDGALRREQEDLALVVLLAALVGAGAAIAAAQVAARALASPVSDLRAAALAIGRGERLPELGRDAPLEFEPVFAGFSRMATDVLAGRDALEEARRRTAAVLATVATGVVAVDPEGRILLANGRARAWLAAPLAEGTVFIEQLPAGWGGLGTAVARALAGTPVLPLEIESGDRRYGAEVAGLGTAPGGVVLALTDLTDAAHTARVLAWGEMARQIAHEIKNPLTPLRLGLQHLRRVRGERPAEFDRTFDETSGRILAEIDRLDTVARAFSRFALPADAAAPLETCDLATAADEAIALYRLGDGGAEVRLEGRGPVLVRTRIDELKEVLVNLVENARNAGARQVVLRVGPGRLQVADDGRGIGAADLPRIFEPRFSTTTSGAGLGLSIVKRLVESWGATITATSATGRGTTVTVEFAAGP